MNNAALIQQQQVHDKVMHALIWAYMVPCMLAGVGLILLGATFAILKAVIRKKLNRHRR